jgi:hypothetical protein
VVGRARHTRLGVCCHPGGRCNKRHTYQLGGGGCGAVEYGLPRAAPHRAPAEALGLPCWEEVSPLGGGSHVWQPEWLAPPEAFVQRLARQTQQASSYALIAVGVPQCGGNQGVFGLFQGGEWLRIPRTLGG